MIDDRAARDLIAWLRTVLDEDERLARGALGRGQPWRLLIGPFSRCEVMYGEITIYGLDEARLGPGYHTTTAEHIFNHEPDSVLGLVAAHRAILDGVERYLDPHPGQSCTNEGDPWDSCQLHVARMATAVTPYAAQLLGVAYAHRAGYLEEWRPSRVWSPGR